MRVLLQTELIFAKLDLPFIPENIDLDDNGVLHKLDEKNVIALAGTCTFTVMTECAGC